MTKENTDAALKLQVWNLQVGTEDVVDLFKNNFVTLEQILKCHQISNR
jgi:hypothetical protein